MDQYWTAVRAEILGAYTARFQLVTYLGTCDLHRPVQIDDAKASRGIPPAAGAARVPSIERVLPIGVGDPHIGAATTQVAH
jgi:hypothetical protein